MSYETITSKTILKGAFEVGTSYYNPICGKLEPILENTDLVVCYIKNEVSSPSKYITLELNPQNQSHSLNINISEEMVAGLLKMVWSLERELEIFKLKQQEFNKTESKKNIPYQGKLARKNTISKKYYQDYMKYVSIYSLTNQTGYDLEINRNEIHLKSALMSLKKSYNPGISSRNAFDDQFRKNVLIKNGETENFEVISDETNFEKTFHKSHTITLSFETFSGSSIEIQNIELSRIRRKRYYWSQSLLNKTREFFIGEVRVIGSTKNLHLSSSLVFYNNFMKNVFLLLKSPRFKVLQIAIPSMSVKAAPIEYVEEMGSFQIKILQEDEVHYTKTVSKLKINKFFILF